MPFKNAVRGGWYIYKQSSSAWEFDHDITTTFILFIHSWLNICSLVLRADLIELKGQNKPVVQKTHDKKLWYVFGDTMHNNKSALKLFKEFEEIFMRWK